MCRALITDDRGRILFAKKAGSEFWSLPGGKLDGDDTSLQSCLVRELKEELGVDAEIGTIRFVQELHKDNTRYVELIWSATIHGSPPSEDISKISGGELEAVQWISKSELRNANIKPDFLKELE